MKDRKKIKAEAKTIMDKLLEINNNDVKINKYMHELVFDMVENKNDFVDVLYEAVTLIPLELNVTTDRCFKFDTHDEFMRKHTKLYQHTIYDK